ncbi:hypothetical protein COOONC_16342 [Cooperia oncophora]
MFEPEQPSTARQLEAVAVGKIEMNVYMTYLKAFSYKWAFIFLSLLFCRYVMQALSSIWLSSWADSNVKEPTSSNTIRGLAVFVALGILHCTLQYYCNCIVYVWKHTRFSSSPSSTRHCNYASTLIVFRRDSLGQNSQSSCRGCRDRGSSTSHKYTSCCRQLNACELF